VEAKMHPKCVKGVKGEAKGRQGEAKGEGRKGVEKQVPIRVQEGPCCFYLPPTPFRPGPLAAKV